MTREVVPSPGWSLQAHGARDRSARAPPAVGTGRRGSSSLNIAGRGDSPSTAMLRAGTTPPDELAAGAGRGTLGMALFRLAHLGEERLDRGLELGARVAEPAPADHALRIEQVELREAAHGPGAPQRLARTGEV